MNAECNVILSTMQKMFGIKLEMFLRLRSRSRDIFCLTKIVIIGKERHLFFNKIHYRAVTNRLRFPIYT